MYKKISHFLVVFASVFFLSGCGMIDYFYLPPPEDTAQELFETANDFMAEKNYVAAIERYNKLRDAYPFSPYTIDAELALADAYFLDEEYSAAVEAYKDFESLHPRHESMPYVLYQIGVARVKGFMSIDRPTTELQDGYMYFDRLIQSYPHTEYAKAAPDYMKQIRELMAEHELYVANVFFQMEKYNSAWKRYTYVVDNFPDVPKSVEFAKERGLIAYHEYTKRHGDVVREKREGSWKKWFTWL